MGVYLARRLVLSAVVLLALSYGTYWFFATNFFDLTGDQGSPTTLWWHWLQGVPSLRSFTELPPGFGQPRLVPALGHTALLLGVSFALVIVFGLALGVVAAATAGSALDLLLRVAFYAAWAVPAFLLALMLQSVFQWVDHTFGVQVFPLTGWAGHCPSGVSGFGFDNEACGAGSGLDYAASVAQHIVLPAVALAGSFIGLHARYLRSSLLVSLGMPYTTTARAKGLPERAVLLRHALRNSLVTFASALLLDFGAIFGAALAVDFVFRLGGVGSLFLQLISDARIDPNQVTSLLTATAVLVLLVSLLNDVVVSFFDPRVMR